MKYFLILFCILLVSCSQPKDTNFKINLFNDISFELKEWETNPKINPVINKDYVQFFNHDSVVQIPLLKYIQHKNYSIFIGLPFNTTMKDISQRRIETDDSVSIYSEGDSTYFYRKYQKDSLYLMEYVFRQDHSSLIYISGLTKSKNASDSVFSKTKLSERISKK